MSLASVLFRHLVVASLAVAAAAQSEIHVPDNAPALGTCNAAPFGAATMTYVCRIPAALLIPAQPHVDDLAFTSCSTGTMVFPTLQMGIGHVPNPLPLPFTFPTFDAAGLVLSLGSFLDYTPVWNTVIQGSLVWPYTSGVWAPMGFAALGGTGFTWNGANDIGCFLTFQGATGTNAFHRTSTEPFRAYQSGVYQATSSVTTGASGAKIRLTVHGDVPCANGTCPSCPMVHTLRTPPLIGTTVQIGLDQAPVNQPAWCVMNIGHCLGSGPVLPPLCGSALVALNGSIFTLGVNVPTGTTGCTGSTTFVITVPADPGFAGLQLASQCIMLCPPTGTAMSNCVSWTLQ